MRDPAYTEMTPGEIWNMLQDWERERQASDFDPMIAGCNCTECNIKREKEKLTLQGNIKI